MTSKKMDIKMKYRAVSAEEKFKQVIFSAIEELERRKRKERRARAKARKLKINYIRHDEHTNY